MHTPPVSRRTAGYEFVDVAAGAYATQQARDRRCVALAHGLVVSGSGCVSGWHDQCHAMAFLHDLDINWATGGFAGTQVPCQVAPEIRRRRSGITLRNDDERADRGT